MTFALITGATAGIGAEFARQLARRGDNLVLVARDEARLHRVAAELRQRHHIDVEVLVADLLTEPGVALLEQRLSDGESPIDLLVNNAGYGIRGDLHETSHDVERDHLAIHVAVPLRLSQAAIRGMVARGTGRIVLVASVAAFTPRGTYSAAKAWAVMFARAMNVRYRSQGVTVTALCPGFVRTEFHERMGVRTDTIPAALWLSTSQVVRLGLRGITRGRSVVIPTLRYRLIAALARIVPDRLAAAGQFRSRD